MRAILSNVLADPDSLGDAIGAFGLLAAVVVGCWIGEAFGLWGA